MSDRRIRLRRPRATDAADLSRAWIDQARLYADAGPTTFTVPDEDGLGGWLVDSLQAQADPDVRLVLVADVDDRAVGFAIAAVIAPHPDAQRQMQRDLATPRVRVEALVVRSDAQHHGVGTRLLTAIEDWARNRGATTVTAQAPIVGPAGDFLAARGYGPAATVHTRRL